MRLEVAGDALGDDVGSHVEILQSRVASVRVDDERVLLDDPVLLALLRLARPELLLHLLDDAERSLQVCRRSCQLARLLLVRRPVSPVLNTSRESCCKYVVQ